MNRTAKVNRFITRLAAARMTFAIAESMTCGLAAHLLANCKGTSQVLRGSVDCYSEEVKTGLLGVGATLIDRHTAESKEVTRALAKHLRRLVSADIYGAITGLASNGGSESKGKPVGTVFLCAMIGNTVYEEKRVFRGTPLQIRTKAALALYDLVLRKMK